HMYTSGGVTLGPWGFWVSKDGGETWVMPGAFVDGMDDTWTSDIYNIAVDPEDFNHFVMTSHRGWPCCGEDAGLLESRDGGETFIVNMPVTGMNHGNGIAILSKPELDLGNGDTWLVGGGDETGIYRTENAGESWTRVSDSQDSHGGL